jgi:hypothetical protein
MGEEVKASIPPLTDSYFVGEFVELRLRHHLLLRVVRSPYERHDDSATSLGGRIDPHKSGTSDSFLPQILWHSEAL